MAVITVSGPISGKGYQFKIAGDSPTVDEQKRIDALISQDEQAFQKEYAATFGAPVDTGESTGLWNQVEEIPKGLAAGAVGFGESAGLGIATLLPEKYETPVREAIRRGAYAMTPQADIGLENSGVRQISEGLGSVIPPYLLQYVPVIGQGLTVATTLGAGAGEASERARQAGATQDQRNMAALKGAFVGSLDVVPVFGSLSKFLGPTGTNKFVNYITEIAIQGGEEAAQEATTQVLQNMIQRGYDPSQDLGEGTLQSAGIGGLAGAIVQALLPGRQHGGNTPSNTPPAPPSATTPAATGTGTPTPPAGTPPAAGTAPVVKPDTEVEAAPDQTTLDETFAEIESTYRIDRPTAQSIYDTVSKAPDADVAIAQLSEQLGVEPFNVKETYRSLQYEVQKGQRLAAPTAPVKAPKGKKAKAAAPTLPTASINDVPNPAPTVESTAPTPPVTNQTLTPNATPASGTQATQGTVPTVSTDVLNAAKTLIADTGKASVSFLQRSLKLPLTDAKALVAQLEAEGAVSPPNNVGKRTINRDKLVPSQETTDEQPAAPVADGTGVGPDGGQPGDAAEATAGADNGAGNAAAPDDGAMGSNPASPTDANAGEGEQPAPLNTTPAIWASKDFDIPVDMLPEPAQVDPKTGEKYQKVRQQDGNINFAPVSQLRPVSEAPKAQEFSANAAPGAVSGAAGQAIPSPGIKPVPTTARKEKAPKPQAKPMPPIDEAANAEAQAKLDARWQAHMAKVESKTPGAIEYFLENSVSVGADPTGPRDKNLILDLLGTSEKELVKDPNGRRAKAYFEKYRNPGDALEAMAYDAVLSDSKTQYKPGKEEIGTPEAAFRMGTARAQAQAAIEWVNTNLTSRSTDYVGEMLEVNRKFMKNTLGKNAKRDRVMDARNRAKNRVTEEEAQVLDENYEAFVKADRAATENRENFVAEAEAAKAAEREAKQTKYEQQRNRGLKPTMPVPPWAKLLRLDSTIGLDFPLHPDVKNALASGNLKAALSALANTTPNPYIARVAEKLAAVTGNTKVVLADNLTNELGEPISGAFDPKTNTITLDRDNGLNPHVVLHEMTHAATSAALANPSHPMTKRLTRLFESVKDALPGEYGSTSLDEFVSEAFSNPHFQEKLAQLREIDSDISAWTRFKTLIGNFLRRIVGLEPVEPNALNEATRLIEALVDTSPDSRNAGNLYMISRSPVRAANTIDNAMNSGIVPTKESIDNAVAIYNDTKNSGWRWIKKGAMQLTPLHLLVQMATPLIKSAPKLNTLVNNNTAVMSQMRDMLHVFADKLGGYQRAARSRMVTIDGQRMSELDVWNRMARESTFYEADPALTEAEAVKKYGKGGDPEGKFVHYDRLRKMYEALSPEGKQRYAEARNAFRYLRQRALESITANVKSLFPDDPAAADRIMKTFFARLTAQGSIDPYLPLTREGDFWLTMNVMDPNTRTMEVFSRPYTTERERKAAYDALVEQNLEDFAKYRPSLKAEQYATAMDVRMTVGRESIDYSNVPPQSFVAQLMQQLRKQNADEATIRAVTNLILDTMPETAYAKSFRTRKGILGANEDMIGAITNKANFMGRKVVQMEFRPQYQRLKTEMENDFKNNPAAQNSLAARDMLDQLNAITSFAISPTRGKWSRAATSAGFFMTLGFNPSSALLNFFQIPGIVLPYLSGEYGMNASSKALAEARRMMTASGRSRKVKTVLGNNASAKLSPDTASETLLGEQDVKAGYSLSNYDFNDPKLDARTRRLKYLVEEGEKMGQFNRSQVYDMLDLDGQEGIGTKVMAASGFFMHHSERIVREMTLAASYNLEVDKLEAAAKEKGQTLTEEDYRKAAQKAVQVTEETNGGVAAAATPRIAHSGFGSVVFMYKRFAVSMYGMLIKMARQAWKGQSPEAKKIARYQLAGIFGVTGLMSGVAGLPLYGSLAAVWNFLLQDDDEEDFETLTRRMVGDGPYHGLINYMTGVNVATRIGLTDLLFRENLVERDQSRFFTLFEQLGGPVVGTALNLERGLNLMADGEIQRGIESLTPAVLRSLLRAGRFAIEGAETMDGKPIIDDLNGVQLAAQVLGFNSAEYQNQIEKNAKKKKFERAVLEQRKKLLDRFAYAQFEGDKAEAQDVLEEMRAYSQKYPELAITSETLKDSRTQRTRSRATAYHGVTFDPRLRARAEAFGGQ